VKRRHQAGLAGCAAFALFALMHHLAPALYLFISAIPDGARKPTPFIDLSAILQARQCWLRGVNVYAPSSCLGGGVYNYTPFLLRLPLPNPSATSTGGIALALLFFASLSLLPPPSSSTAARARLAATLSPATYYAIEQANLDLTMFVLAATGLWLATRSGRIAWLGQASFLLGAAIKFYPAALLILLARERLALCLTLAATAALAAALLLATDARGIATALAIIPSGTPFRATFGAIDLLRGLATWHIIPRNPALVRGLTTLASLTLLAAILATSRPALRPLRILPPATAIFLLGGASVILLCFITAQNVEYRAIFLLLTFPALGHIPRGRYLRAAITALLWEAALRKLVANTALFPPFWLTREALWWWLTFELGRYPVGFLQAECTRLWREAKAVAFLKKSSAKNF